MAEDFVERGSRTDSISLVPDATLRLLTELWRAIERSRTLEKYQVALTGSGKVPFPRGESPYQEVSDLLALRNALVHFRPEWDDALDDHLILEHRIKGKFPDNSLAPPTMAWFPSRCLGAGSSGWACRSVRDFSKLFCERLKIPELM